jgi:hypothetical protein
MRTPQDAVADARMARCGGLLAWLPWALGYPLRGFALPVLLMVTLFTALGMNSRPMTSELPMTGIPLLAITALWMLIYLLAIIRHTARGHALPPPLGGEAAFLIAGFRPLLLPALLLTAYYGVADARAGAAQAVAGLALLVLPAHLFILATEDNLWVSLNPLRWLQTAIDIGWAYPAGVVLMGGALAGLGAVSGTLALSTLAAITVYATFLFAHLLGFAGFRRQAQLGLHVEVRHPDAVAREQAHHDALRRLLDDVERTLQVADMTAAARVIERAAAVPLGAVPFFEEVFERMLRRGPALLIHTAGRRLVSALLALGRTERALEVVEHCLNRHPHFEPEDPAQIEPLARLALERRYQPLFERLLRDIDQRHPGHPVTITARWLQARQQAEQANDEAAALALLRPALAEAERRQHPQRDQIAAYARALERLSRHGRREPRLSPESDRSSQQ